ncbi:MAG: hypothetical protein MI919_26455, partial [Holophagales bacterium]|nr:hypothetical protein [Holophagales bacterium]
KPAASRSAGASPLPEEPVEPVSVDADADADGLIFADAPDDPELNPSVEGRLERASHHLMAAEIRDDIGEALLEFAAAFFRRRLLLVARKEELAGWMGSGEGITETAVRSISLDPMAPSVFLGLKESTSFWLGPLPPLPANLTLVEALGGEAPRDCVALPVVLRSKVVGYLYADDLDRGVGGAPVAELKRLVGKAGLAFEIYILRNKLRVM